MAASASPAVPPRVTGVLLGYKVTEGDLEAARAHLDRHGIRFVGLCSAGGCSRGLAQMRFRHFRGLYHGSGFARVAAKLGSCLSIAVVARMAARA